MAALACPDPGERAGSHDHDGECRGDVAAGDCEGHGWPSARGGTTVPAVTSRASRSGTSSANGCAQGATKATPLVVSWEATLQMTRAQWNAEIVGMRGITTG